MQQTFGEETVLFIIRECCTFWRMTQLRYPSRKHVNQTNQTVQRQPVLEMENFTKRNASQKYWRISEFKFHETER